eukprot:11840162-Alexandrium_andersonii.AAC.1
MANSLAQVALEASVLLQVAAVGGLARVVAVEAGVLLQAARGLARVVALEAGVLLRVAGGLARVVA